MHYIIREYSSAAFLEEFEKSSEERNRKSSADDLFIDALSILLQDKEPAKKTIQMYRL